MSLIYALLAIAIPLFAWRVMATWMGEKGNGKIISHLTGAGIASLVFVATSLTYSHFYPQPDTTPDPTINLVTDTSPDLPADVQNAVVEPTPITEEKEVVIAKPSSDNERREVSKQSKQVDQPIKVSATKLFQDYKSNEIAADKIYKGKVLDVSGVISSIEKDVLGGGMLMLKASRDYDMVSALIDPSMLEKASKLKRGANITVRCVGDGGGFGVPVLTSCKY